MKKYFLAGIAILLPVTLTAIILNFLINVLTHPFEGAVRYLANYLTVYSPVFATEYFLFFASRLIVLASIFFFVVLVGFLGEMYFVSHFFKALDTLMKRVPLINKIYHALQEVVHTFFHEESSSFSQVVLAPFPSLETKQIGFITNGKIPEESDEEFRDLVSVFICGTPNPTMGFMILYKKDDLTYLNTKVEEGFKFVVSCGVLNNNFNS